MAADSQPPRPFSLRRRFALTSLAVIVLIAVGLGALLSNMLADRMLRREGEVSQSFTRALLQAEGALGFFQDPRNPDLERRFVSVMQRLGSTGPVRANAFGVDGQVLWSTDASLIGRRDADNDELAEALAGDLVVHSGTLSSFGREKREHAGLSAATHYYVESYIPVRAVAGGPVVGVVELYRVPVQLSASIREAVLQLWLACAGSGLALFLALNGIVGRADRVMRDQQAHIAESQALESAVELAGAVAHNLRNPLASIRTTAEMLAPGAPAPELAEYRGDIIGSVDRADRWITELVRVSNAEQLPLEAVDATALWRDCLREVDAEMERQRVTWELAAGAAPAVRANAAMLRQVLLSVLVNAIEAMPLGGAVRIGWAVRGGSLVTTLDDTGGGVAEEARHAMFRPFFSTKSGGLGIGLALARKTLAQWGGSIDLRSQDGVGSRLTIVLPLAATKEA